jgi:signal transduction histidine kinase
MTRRFGGTGLGLAIAHRWTKRMGGDIGFKRLSPAGALFWVEMPCDAP